MSKKQQPIAIIIAILIIAYVIPLVMVKHIAKMIWSLVQIFPLFIWTVLKFIPVFSWGLLRVALVIIKTAVLVLLGLALSPIWYPIYLFIQRSNQKTALINRKKQLRDGIELMDILSTESIRLVDYTVAESIRETVLFDDEAYFCTLYGEDAYDPEFDFEWFLIEHLMEIKESKGRLAIRIDWKDIDEVEPQTNAVLSAHGIVGNFKPTTLTDYAHSIESALCEYDSWLVKNGYRFILWDQGSDEYFGFICKQDKIDTVLELSKSIGLDFRVNMFLHFNISFVKAEIIENLIFLIASAKERNIDQGVTTFSYFAEDLKHDSCNVNELYESLYRNISGMSRFADFTDDEWCAVESITGHIEAHQKII
ncbi:DUF6630 family protein [Reinekea thalattae]|uniref:DUF6630 domain-containing protein n=1 Tax=Reinekea thalattae TaxID=2593301 RepID=A0A5C8ZA67_9GAMM|nr:hypothetical protein [Reinekea thalattae]TXR54852.1 hypothetical protein FME95_10045 [Reinekea thalattae]